MRALIQRVREARVASRPHRRRDRPGSRSCSAAMAADDTDADRDWLARKIVALRIFDDDAGVMNRSVVDVGGDDPRRQPVHAVRVDAEGQPAVVVGAAPPEVAQPQFDAFVAALARELGKPVATGVFGARHAGRARQRRPGDDLARFARTASDRPGRRPAAGALARRSGRAGRRLVSGSRGRTARRRQSPSSAPRPNSVAAVPLPCPTGAPATLDGRGVLRSRWLRRAALLLAALAAAVFVFRDPILGTPVESTGDARRHRADGRRQRARHDAAARVGRRRDHRARRAHSGRGRPERPARRRPDRARRSRRARRASRRRRPRSRRPRRGSGSCARSALPAAEQALVQAQANLVLARQQYERTQDLKAKGFVSQSALDDAKRNLDVAQSQLDAARLQVETNAPPAATTDGRADRAGAGARDAGGGAGAARRRPSSARPSTACSSAATSSPATSCSRARS